MKDQTQRPILTGDNNILGKHNQRMPKRGSLGGGICLNFLN